MFRKTRKICTWKKISELPKSDVIIGAGIERNFWNFVRSIDSERLKLRTTLPKNIGQARISGRTWIGRGFDIVRLNHRRRTFEKKNFGFAHHLIQVQVQVWGLREKEERPLASLIV